MSLSKLVNSSYPRVLYEYANKENRVKEIHDQAQDVLNALNRDDKMLYEMLRNYNISKEMRKDIIDDVFKDHIDEYFILLLKTIVDFNRCSSLITIVKGVLRLCNKKINSRYIKIYSAFELTEAQKNKLAEALKKHYHADSIDINNVVVPGISGGLKIVSEEDSINTSYISKLISIKDESIKALSKYQIKEDVNNG